MSEKTILAEFYKSYSASAQRKTTAMKKQLLNKLYEKPKPDSSRERSHVDVQEPSAALQADLLQLPVNYDEKGHAFNWVLVCVDLYNGSTDAQPLQNKSSQEVLEAFKAIFERKNVLCPKYVLQVDGGSEFKSVVSDYFHEKGVIIRVGQAYRHKQQSVVEERNKVIGKALFQRMIAEELSTGEESAEWLETLPLIIQAINTVQTKRPRSHEVKDASVFATKKNMEVLNVGDQVRAKLEAPREMSGQLLHGNFRETDPKWSPKIRTIKKVIIHSNSPPRYMLDGTHGTLGVSSCSYSRNELQLVEKDEQLPPKELFTTKEPFTMKKIDEVNEDLPQPSEMGEEVEDNEEVVYKTKSGRPSKAPNKLNL